MQSGWNFRLRFLFAFCRHRSGGTLGAGVGSRPPHALGTPGGGFASRDEAFSSLAAGPNSTPTGAITGAPRMTTRGSHSRGGDFNARERSDPYGGDLEDTGDGI